MPTIEQMLDEFDEYNWNSAKQRIKAEFRLDFKTAACEDYKLCDYTMQDVMGRSLVDSRVCVLAFFEIFCLIICPPDKNMMSVEKISYKNIKVVHSEKKLFKGMVTIQTDDASYAFTLPKKEVDGLEKMISRYKNRT